MDISGLSGATLDQEEQISKMNVGSENIILYFNR